MPFIDDPTVTRRVPAAQYSVPIPGKEYRAEVSGPEFTQLPRVARFKDFPTFIPPPDPQEGFPYIWVFFRRTQDAQQYNTGYKIDLAVDGVSLVAPVGAATWRGLADGGGYASLRWGYFMTSALANGTPTLLYTDFSKFKMIEEANMTDPPGADLVSFDADPWAVADPAFTPFYIADPLLGPTKLLLQGVAGQWKLVNVATPATPVIEGTATRASAFSNDPYGFFIDSVGNVHGTINASGQNGVYKASLSSWPAAPTYEGSAFDETGRPLCGLRGMGPGGADTLYLSTTSSTSRFFRICRITAGTLSFIGYVAPPITGLQINGSMQIFTHPTTGLHYLITTQSTTSNVASRLCYIYELSNPESPTLIASLCDPNYGPGRITVEFAYGSALKGDKFYFWHGGSAAAGLADEGLWVVDLEDMNNITTKAYTKGSYHPSTESLGMTVPGGSIQFWAGLTGPYTT